MEIPLQETSLEIWSKKYELKDLEGGSVDNDIDGTYDRVATALASVEEDKDYWKGEFTWALENGAIPAGRIMSNAGAEKYKPATSLINCTVSSIIQDSIEGIMDAVKESALTLKAGCGIGYEFSTLRPKGAYVAGAGAYTSGSLSFMDIFDKMCFTISSAGGRRGAEMGTMAIWHPDVEDFIKAKREDGRLRQFNLSLLIDNEFIDAVKNNEKYQLYFPVSNKEGRADTDTYIWKPLPWDREYCYNKDNNFVLDGDKILCKVYKEIDAVDLWDIIMLSTYNNAEPGFLLIDEINRMNNNWFCETIRSTNPCGQC